MFGIGGTEFALILLFAFLIFGPDKLPGMGRTIGRALRQFRQAQDGLTQVVRTEIVEPASARGSSILGADAADTDADAEPADESDRRPAETFAERKARLEAERKAAAEAAAAESPDGTAREVAQPAQPVQPAVSYGDPDSDADIDATTGAVVLPSDSDDDAAEPAAQEHPVAEPDDETSLAALYGRSSRRARRVAAARPKAADEAGDAPASAEPTTDSGEEAGGERA